MYEDIAIATYLLVSGSEATYRYSKTTNGWEPTEFLSYIILLHVSLLGKSTMGRKIDIELTYNDISKSRACLYCVLTIFSSQL